MGFGKQARGLAVARPNVEDGSSRSHPRCIHETGCVLNRAVEMGSGFRFEATVVPHQCRAVSRIQFASSLKQNWAFLFVSLRSPAAEHGAPGEQLSNWSEHGSSLNTKVRLLEPCRSCSAVKASACEAKRQTDVSESPKSEVRGEEEKKDNPSNSFPSLRGLPWTLEARRTCGFGRLGGEGHERKSELQAAEQGSGYQLFSLFGSLALPSLTLQALMIPDIRMVSCMCPGMGGGAQPDF